MLTVSDLGLAEDWSARPLEPVGGGVGRGVTGHFRASLLCDMGTLIVVKRLGQSNRLWVRMNYSALICIQVCRVFRCHSDTIRYST